MHEPSPLISVIINIACGAIYIHFLKLKLCTSKRSGSVQFSQIAAEKNIGKNPNSLIYQPKMASQISKRGIATAMSRMSAAASGDAHAHGELYQNFDCIILECCGLFVRLNFVIWQS